MASRKNIDKSAAGAPPSILYGEQKTDEEKRPKIGQPRQLTPYELKRRKEGKFGLPGQKSAILYADGRPHKNAKKLKPLDASKTGSQTDGVSKVEHAIGELASALSVSREALAEVLSIAGLLPAAKTELTKKPLPQKARVLFVDREGHRKLAGLNIMDFLRAEYRPWLDGTMSRAHLRSLDPSAYKAVQNWLLNKELPEDVKLPIHKEVTNRKLRDLVLGQAKAPKGKSALTTMISRKLAVPK